MTEEKNLMKEMSPELRNFIENLDNIPWLKNIGQQIDRPEVKQIFSLVEAWENLQDESWANASFHNHIDSMNPVWDIAYDKTLDAASKTITCQKLEEGINVVDAIAYDAAAAAVEIATGSKNTFFINLMHWYHVGHWPCGWEGEYPEGRLIVY